MDQDRIAFARFRFFAIASAALGFSGVALGAFGAHGLEDLLTETGRLEVWKTAVFYQIVHLPVILIALLFAKGTGLRGVLFGAVISFFAGILVFSGSLYLLCLTQQSWLGAVTPIGGLALLVGWVLLGLGLREAGTGLKKLP